MLSLEQLSQTVYDHLGLNADGLQHLCKWTVGPSQLGGRGLIALEDIMPGDVLFVDRPLLQGPRSGTNTQQGCSVCGKIINEDVVKCRICALILCSIECQSSNTHSCDCGVISRWQLKVPIEEVDSTLLSRALTAIRALLLDDKRRGFMAALEAHHLPRHGSEIKELTQYFEISEDEVETMVLACCVLDANAFEIGTPYGYDDVVSLRGLYPVSGLMNHNCVSNTRHSFNNDSQMAVKASKMIPAGSEIFTCYPGMLWGTPARRAYLYKTKHFKCECDRCTDPTERGTLLAALKCFSTDCPGSLLPVEPLKFSTPWKCLQCGLRVPSKNISAIQSALGSLMGSLDFGKVDELENFLLNRVTKYIPRTNQIVVDLQCKLIWALGEYDGLRWHELSDQRLSLKENLCRGTLRTAAALGVGDAHLRGLLLYHLHAALAERARRAPDLYETLKPEIESTIDQSHNILLGDISAPPDIELRWRYLGPGSDKPREERFFILDSN